MVFLYKAAQYNEPKHLQALLFSQVLSSTGEEQVLLCP